MAREPSRSPRSIPAAARPFGDTATPSTSPCLLATLPAVPGPSRHTRLLTARDRLRGLYSPACHLCPIHCAVDRAAGERGECGLAAETPVYRRLVHLGEERALVPSYAVWLAGCSFLCTFCSDEHALRPPLPGLALPADELAEAVAAELRAYRERRPDRPLANLNFVGGEPSISLPYLVDLALALLERDEALPPLLLNTNAFMTVGALEAAIDAFEIFVADLKFGSDTCAAACGAARPYERVVQRNLRRLAESGRELWVRHLLMPGHIDCCTAPALGFLRTLPSHVRVNVMPAFVSFDRRWGRLGKAEVERARVLLADANLPNAHWDGRPLAPESTSVAPR